MSTLRDDYLGLAMASNPEGEHGLPTGHLEVL